MTRTTLLLLATIFASGCSSLHGVPSLSGLKRSEAKSESRNKTAEAPMSQLGVALPAMKPGDDRELKIIAAGQMATHGYWNEAVELYLDAESMAPKKPKLDVQLAPALAGAGRYPESIERYRRLVKVNAKDAELANNFAFTLMESGDPVAAENEFQRALTLDPKSENAAVNLGLLVARQQRYDEALAVLIPAIGEAAAYHNLGVLAIEVGDEKTAKQHFEVAASLPSAPKATHEFIAALSHSTTTATRLR